MNIRLAPVVTIIGVLLSVIAPGGHTVITPPNNKYSPAQDVELGRKAAVEVEQHLPKWLGDYPNPADRDEYVTREAELLEVHDQVRETRAFTRAQTRLRRMTPAPTTEDATQKTAGRGPAPVADERLDSGRMAPPWSTYTMYTEGDLFRVSVPSNWRERPRSNTVTFSPDGAYSNGGGQTGFSHCVEIGVARYETHDLRTATDELVASLARDNPNLSQPSGYDLATIGGRPGLRTVISNVSAATGEQERIALFTVLLRDASLFYALGVAPRGDFSEYEGTFQRVVGSIQIMD